jgi:hypothetical protein
VFAKEEESARSRSGTPIVAAIRRLRPGAQTSPTDGSNKDLAEMSSLRFGADGLVVRDRDFWAQG